MGNVLSTHNKHQLDIRAYTYLYHMGKYIAIRPYDCQPVERSEDITNSVESMIYSFNAWHPLIQLKFNDYDYYHRQSYFKKGPECRMDLLQQHILVAKIYFDKNSTINQYFIDRSKRKVTLFKYVPKRNIGDQFMNMNNDIVTTVMTCNNDVNMGDKVCFFHETIY